MQPLVADWEASSEKEDVPLLESLLESLLEPLEPLVAPLKLLGPLRALHELLEPLLRELALGSEEKSQW